MGKRSVLMCECTLFLWQVFAIPQDSLKFWVEVAAAAAVCLSVYV